MAMKLSKTNSEVLPVLDIAGLFENLKVVRYFLFNIKRSNDYILPLTLSLHRFQNFQIETNITT